MSLAFVVLTSLLITIGLMLLSTITSVITVLAPDEEGDKKLKDAQEKSS